jgi:hypothetical protein
MNPLIPAAVSALLEAVQPAPAVPPSPWQAVLRTIPDHAAVGRMQPAEGMAVVLDKRLVPLAPGVRIRGPENRIELPGSFAGPVLVRYLADGSGAITHVWILNAEEAAAAARR